MTVLCALVLVALNGVGGFFVLNALMTASEGSWDTTATDTVRLMAVLGIASELLAAGLTAAFVAVARLRCWWYAVPAALITVAVLRMVFAAA
ncbi:hypothetical protein DVA86_00055 [Streptomyces armeniacus]|uniref:Uncharacterized protein n=2 Tax=Streptomyces armeniacus TaxID=83291 RepID=A0A345XI10_9ACTN|nr:hypothetical protein DVA86_00055 [Streptomyces armeniacus]